MSSEIPRSLASASRQGTVGAGVTVTPVPGAGGVANGIDVAGEVGMVGAAVVPGAGAIPGVVGATAPP